MTKEEKHALARKIINITDKEIDEDEFIHQLLSENTLYNIYEEEKISFGEKAADKLAEFAGSWGFVIIFMFVLIVWITANMKLLSMPFDPYPFILLNLFLSCVSALQAPLIMMSQNRQEQKDRLKSDMEYKINLKSEIIVEDMHYKLDAIISNQRTIIKLIDNLDDKS